MEGSLELQNGGLSALEDASNDFEIEAFSVKSGRFLVLRRLQVTPGGSCVPGGPWSSGEGHSSRTVP